MPKQPYYELQDIDEVERMRQVRRELEQQFSTLDEFCDWLAKLQAEHDREVRAKRRRRAKAKTARSSG